MDFLNAQGRGSEADEARPGQGKEAGREAKDTCGLPEKVPGI